MQISEILKRYTKSQLLQFGRALGCEISSREKVLPIRERLEWFIIHEPLSWMCRMPERDLLLLKELVNSESGTVQDPACYPPFVNMLGVLDIDEGDDGALVSLDPLLERMISPFLDDAIEISRKSGRFDFEAFSLGVFNTYGIVPYKVYLDLLLEWYDRSPKNEDTQSLESLISSSFLLSVVSISHEGGLYFMSPLIDNPYDIFEPRRELMKGKRKYKHYSVDYFASAGASAPLFQIGEGTEEFNSLKKAYVRAGYKGEHLLLAIHQTWLDAQMMGRGREDYVYDTINDAPYSEDIPDQEWSRMITVVAEYVNSVPKWKLLGYSAKDTGLCLAPDEGNAPLEEYPFFSGFAVPHVAPDEPCPCGSGLIYSHCHGKYLS